MISITYHHDMFVVAFMNLHVVLTYEVPNFPHNLYQPSEAFYDGIILRFAHHVCMMYHIICTYHHAYHIICLFHHIISDISVKFLHHDIIFTSAAGPSSSHNVASPPQFVLSVVRF